MNLRIISGELGRRQIKSPNNAYVHPMSERMRQALFNSLGDLHGKVVLDAFAGSGAVGIEAISRGDQYVTLIEKDRVVVNTLIENVEDLKVGAKAHVVRANVFGWTDKSDEKFDIIIADPPYDLVDSNKTVDKLKNHLNSSGIMVLSHSGSVEHPRVDGVVVVGTRSYANGKLTFYRSQ